MIEVEVTVKKAGDLKAETAAVASEILDIPALVSREMDTLKDEFINHIASGAELMENIVFVSHFWVKFYKKLFLIF